MRYTNLRSDWPPLQVWVLFFALAGIMAASLLWYVMARRDTLQIPAEVLLEARMEAFSKQWQADQARYKVIIIGSSLVRAGIAETPFFSDSLLSVYKIWENGADQEVYFEREQLLPRLLDYQPDLILLEESLVVWRRPESDQVRAAGDYLGTFSEELRWLLLGPAWYSGARAYNRVDPVFDDPHPMHTHQLRDSVNLPAILWEPRNFRQDTALHQWLATCRSVGIPVAVLHIPRPPLVESELRAGSRATYFQELTNWYAQEWGVSFLEGPPVPTYLYYRDHAHLNARGAEWYSGWLKEQLRQRATKK